MKIKLEHDEMTICNIIGRMRSLIARSAGVKDTKVGSHDGVEADIMGLTAEYAFAKMFNTFPDLGLTPRSGSSDGLINGYRYDIKSTTYKSGKLLSTLKINNDIDMYVLAVVDNNSVDFVGYAFKNELIKESNKRDLGHGRGYCLEQSQLRKFKEKVK